MNAVIKGDQNAKASKPEKRSHNLKFAGVLVGATVIMTALMLPITMYNNKSEKPGLMDKQKTEQTAPVKLTAEEERFEFARGFMGAADTLFNRGSYKAAAEAYGVAANGFKKLGYTNFENEAYGKQVAAYDTAIKSTNEVINGGYSGSGLAIQDDYWNRLKPLQEDLNSLESKRAAAQRNYDATRGRPGEI